MKKRTRPLSFVLVVILCPAVIMTCASMPKQAVLKPAPVTFPSSKEEQRIEEMHSKVFNQLGGYKGPEACYACHQKAYRDISASYHVHQGRITNDGLIAHDPADAVDTGMYMRWYPLSNLDRRAEPEKHWKQMEAIFCAQCHPGGGVLKPYGMDVDCLICHQKTGYRGGRGLGKSLAGTDREGNIVYSDGGRFISMMMAGADVGGDMDKIDLSNIAAQAMQNVELRVGKPGPDNCNFCHWRTDGKRGTRYGLFKGEPADVHYEAGMSCQECHVTENHQIGKGKILDAIGTPELRGTMLTCADCHDEDPHSGEYAEDISQHLDKIACETCHTVEAYPGAESVNWLPGMDMEGMMKQYEWMMPIARIMGMASPENMSRQIEEMVDCYKDMKPRGFNVAHAWHNREILCKEIPNPKGSRNDPGSIITPFSVVNTTHFNDGSTHEVVQDPNGHADGHPVPKAFVARAGGGGVRDTTLDEMRRWQGGAYKSVIIREIPMYFQRFHSIAPAKNALKCNDCHTENGRLDFTSLGYSLKEVEMLSEER